MGRKALLALIVMLVGALGCASAYASPPEFGRCLKKAEKTLTPGSYDSAKCVKEAAEDPGTEAEKLRKGNFEWIAGVVPGHTRFTISGGAVTLQTIEGKTVVCSGQKGEGEYSLANSKQIAGVALELEGCTTAGLPCTTVGRSSGELVFNELAGEVGLWGASRAKTALKLEPGPAAGAEFIDFTCEGLEVQMRGKGGIPGEGVLVPIKNDTMVSADILKFNASKGVQKPIVWEGFPAETYIEMNFEHAGWHEAGWTSETTLANDEAFKYELNRVL